METLIRYAILFFAYSFAGWCIEVTLKFIQYRRFINRGFLTGPVLPIYGSGAVLITAAVEGLTRFESSYGTTFVLAFVLCGTLEYMTSYVMEKQFHARWWDYSQKPMNLHGRIWIGNLVLFGLGGVAIVHFVNPLIDRGIALVSLQTWGIIVAVLAVIFVVDFVMTQFILKLVKTGVEKSEADNTEDIQREIRLLLSDKSVFYRRFANAYPDVVYRTERINAKLADVKAEAERIRKEAEQRLEEQKQLVVSTIEPASMIKNTIIRKQDALIDLLYDENTADDEMKALKREITQEKERLDTRPLAQVAKTISKIERS